MTAIEQPSDQLVDQLTSFGGLVVESAQGVLPVRPWTVQQSEWGAELAAGSPVGPILELFSGGGQIGLECARLADRSVVLVDRDPGACDLARRNARRNALGEQTRVVCADVAPAILEIVEPAVILADPPYIPSHQVTDHPEDPPHAIDGGPDGLGLAHHALISVAGLVASGVPLVLQLGGRHQVETLRDRAASLLSSTGIDVVEERTVAADRVLVLFRAQ